MTEIVKERHEETHWGSEAMISSLQDSIICVGMTGIVKSITVKCPICLKNNPMNRKRPPSGTTRHGNSPGDYWQIDFSELPKQNGYKYLLVLVDTFSGWPEAFPCCTNKAREVTKLLLKEIIPRFGVPIGMSSDQSPHFVADIVQQLSKILGIKWDLHTPWRPQSSGKVERVNQTLKLQISKICQETSLKWPQAFPLALLRIRIQPRSRNKISLYEIIYGKPYQAPLIPGEIHVKGRTDLKLYLISLGKALAALRRYIVLTGPLTLDTPAHRYQPGDSVYIKTWNSEPLQEKWKGPFQVLLMTYTAVRVDGIDSWIHYIRVKKAPSLEQGQWASKETGPLKLTFYRLCYVTPYLHYMLPVVLFITSGSWVKFIVLLHCVTLAYDMIKWLVVRLIRHYGYSNPRDRHCGYSNPSDRHCSYSNPSDRHYGYSNLRDRHCGYSNPSDRHCSYSNPSDRHCGYSNPSDRHCGYSNPSDRHCSYSNPSDRHCGYSNPCKRHCSYSNPSDRHCS
ncbi:hypothetical protein QYF61_024288 [Mycteria americana]|uniref:Integrase catalytic domain-containing protein n=1 Tax=Mycteria americana TaxID=33587 RepID=A0AAN7RTF7_MYCAM|nr:hypothetical protein QYF61_024288 [Mycteria americana]